MSMQSQEPYHNSRGGKIIGEAILEGILWNGRHSGACRIGGECGASAPCYFADSTTSTCQVSSIIGICEARISVFLSTNTLMHESMPQSPGTIFTTPGMERRCGVFSAIVSERVFPPRRSVRLDE